MTHVVPAAAGLSAPPFLPSTVLLQRVRELAADIDATEAGSELVLISAGRAPSPFMGALSRALQRAHDIECVALTRHVPGQAGRARLGREPRISIRGRHALIVQDVVDTGLTIAFLSRVLGERGAAVISAACLLDRPYRRLVDDSVLRHVGFTVPDELFAGFGLGPTGSLRSLPDIHVLDAGSLADQRGVAA